MRKYSSIDSSISSDKSDEDDDDDDEDDEDEDFDDPNHFDASMSYEFTKFMDDPSIREG